MGSSNQPLSSSSSSSVEIPPHPLHATSLPGYGLPLATYGSEGHGFKHPLDDSNGDGAGPMLPVREYTMMAFMNQVTDKVRWEEKAFDEEIVEKWKTEAKVGVEGEEEGPPPGGFSERMFEWCIKELRHKATIYKSHQYTEALDTVYKSDTGVPESLRQSLLHAVKPLEDIPDREKDWHPDSDELVLDLVHPSLYPLVYTQSKILPDGSVAREDCLRRAGEGQTIAKPSTPEQSHAWSTTFQWLPTEFSNDKETGKVRALGCINNLRPDHHADLYGVIESIIAHAIPLWSATLTAVKQTDHILPRLDMKDEGYSYPPGVPRQFDYDSPGSENSDDGDDWETRYQAWQVSRTVVHPEPELESIETRYQSVKPEMNVDLSRIPRLQIIVKLANIHLTPSKPKYGGGSWHVEGARNEQICASALYYYDTDNITENHLAFRKNLGEECDVEVPYEQGDHRAVEEIFGFENETDAKLQELGKVSTSQGRLLTFPNVLQHRVEPFELVDKTRPGHRKLLALFLVDPWKPIISTSHVPPQQDGWWKPQVQHLGPLGSLPAELNDNIMTMIDTFPVTMEKAKEQRLELMKERKYVREYQEQEIWQQRTFFLCEH